jgi:tetratricopeptide (TPR) repeat protein
LGWGWGIYGISVTVRRLLTRIDDEEKYFMNRALLLRALLVPCLLLAFQSILGAQSAETSENPAAANSAYLAKDWTKAVPLYEALAQIHPDNARNWYRLGVCLHGVGKNDKALTALQKAKALGAPAQNVEYSLAEVSASLGEKDRALEHLAEAMKQGYAQPEQMSASSDFKTISSDARFAPLLEQARHNEKPCESTPENRQFDFWVGDWDAVTTSDGVPAGISHIERTIGDCVIWENWSSLNSTYSGKSYNTYNSNLKRWEQFWVDNVGGMVHFYGSFANGVMDFYTDDVPQPDGTKARRHLQFFNQSADQVRQFSQISADTGKTWTVEYDLTYNRKK